MLLTLKLLQAKNASTGTISMSKRIMAIQEAFIQNSLVQTNSAAITTSNDISDKKCLPNTKDKPSPLLLNGNKPHSINSEKTPLLAKNPSEEKQKIHENKLSDSDVSKSCVPEPIKGIKKPNSLILVPHQQNIHDMSNGVLKSGDSSFRVVHQCKKSQGSTKEVQTEEKIDEWSLVEHSSPDDLHNERKKNDPILSPSDSTSEKCCHLYQENTTNVTRNTKCNNNVPEDRTNNQKCKEEVKSCKVMPPLLSNNLGQNSKSGTRSSQHTHRLVINLDDKNRFTDEVTV